MIYRNKKEVAPLRVVDAHKISSSILVKVNTGLRPESVEKTKDISTLWMFLSLIKQLAIK